MILSIDIENKSIGNKQLFEELKFSIEDKEKVAIIGRNGVGKTTLFRMLTKEDTDYAGKIQFRNGTIVVSTAQEHHNLGEQSALEYLLANLPDYTRLKHIIDTYPETMGDDIKKIETYSTALERFGDLNYYTIEDDVALSLMDYQLDEAKIYGPFERLSGGQKRFVELVRIEHSNADIALIDEPTNHMDYVAKNAFINWMKATKQTIVVISHDRDVLKNVDRIIEIKNGQAQVFKGNYEAYLAQNAHATATQMHDYEIAQRTLENLQKQIQQARARKPSWSGTADQKNPFVVMERRLQKQYDELKASVVEPNFWIDRESAEGLRKNVSDNYEKFKAKNIRIHKTSKTESKRELLNIEDIELSYSDKPLFKPLTFRLEHGDRIQLVGRNGAGKSTLIRAIVAATAGLRADTWLAGSIFADKKLRLSVYEQETKDELLTLTLEQAVEQIYTGLGLPVSNEVIMRVLSDYLFNPYEDKYLLVANLSGGQKARLQIIQMLANNPNLLILDEPTNHLDLPSIEELENALKDYHGALLYVSHDSYFARNLGGEKLTLVGS